MKRMGGLALGGEGERGKEAIEQNWGGLVGMGMGMGMGEPM